MGHGDRPSAFGRREQRIESFGRRLPDEVEEPRTPSLQLPPARMNVEPVLDEEALADVCKAVEAGIYAATRRALANAVADFAAEQDQATTGQG